MSKQTAQIKAEMKETRQKVAAILARGDGRTMTLNDSIRIDNLLNYIRGLKFSLELLETRGVKSR